MDFCHINAAIAAAAGQADYKNTVSIHALESGFVPHGDIASIMAFCDLSPEKIAEKIKNRNDCIFIGKNI